MVCHSYFIQDSWGYKKGKKPGNNQASNDEAFLWGMEFGINILDPRFQASNNLLGQSETHSMEILNTSPGIITSSTYNLQLGTWLALTSSHFQQCWWIHDNFPPINWITECSGWWWWWWWSRAKSWIRSSALAKSGLRTRQLKMIWLLEVNMITRVSHFFNLLLL